MNQNEAIQYLIDKGKITKEDIEEAQMNTLNDADKGILDNLHTRFCRLNHDELCSWYDEDEDDWTSGDHKRWHDLFIDFLRSANSVKFFPKGITEESTSGSNDSTLSD